MLPSNKHISTVAEERSKTLRFDEDRRAYGHIRRFIERHAGGRPAEWDASVDREELGSYGRSAASAAERARRAAEDMRRGRGGAVEGAKFGPMNANVSARACLLAGWLMFVRRTSHRCLPWSQRLFSLAIPIPLFGVPRGILAIGFWVLCPREGNDCLACDPDPVGFRGSI